MREGVTTWRQQRPDIDREISIFVALVDDRRRLRRELVLALDRASSDVSLGKADRKTLTEIISEAAGSVLEEARDDDALKAVYKRHTRGDFDAEIAVDDAIQARALKGMMEEAGFEFGDTDVSTVEKLKAFAAEQMERLDEQEAAEAERRSRRKKSARQVQAEARRADEERNASKAVQDVYRMLAKELHPDREQDPAERDRKAELMRDVNIAYEAKDLLRLLELQLKLEGDADANSVASLAEDRVRHFNKILDEQCRQLAQELEQVELPYRMQLGQQAPRKLEPRHVIAQIRMDADEVRVDIPLLRGDLEALRDVAGIKAWLKQQRSARTRARSERLGAADAFW